MLVAFGLSVPLGLLLQGYANHGLWLTFLGFMLIRGLSLGVYARRLNRTGAWFVQTKA